MLYELGKQLVFIPQRKKKKANFSQQFDKHNVWVHLLVFPQFLNSCICWALGWLRLGLGLILE